MVTTVKFFGKGTPKPKPKPEAEIRGDLTTRAARYRLKAPLRYRRSGHFGWRNGLTINMSKSGILFSGEVALPPETAVELSISLPQKDTNEPKVVAISGVIIRHTDHEPADPKHTAVMAAKILKQSS